MDRESLGSDLGQYTQQPSCAQVLGNQPVGQQCDAMPRQCRIEDGFAMVQAQPPAHCQRLTAAVAVEEMPGPRLPAATEGDAGVSVQVVRGLWFAVSGQIVR